MERKINEIFRYKGKYVKVVESKVDRCTGCVADESFVPRCMADINYRGHCMAQLRTDKKEVIFKPITRTLGFYLVVLGLAIIAGAITYGLMALFGL